MNFLHNLVEADPQQAPPRVEEVLLRAFRQHHRARRLRRRVIAAVACGAAAAGVVAFVSVPAAVDRPVAVLAHAAPPQIALIKSAPVEAKAAPVHKAVHKPPADVMAAAQFVSLPFGDDSLVAESATIVRVELPRSALRLAGFSVAQERANDRIEADVMLGPDGLAHAVRFVEY